MPADELVIAAAAYRAARERLREAVVVAVRGGVTHREVTSRSGVPKSTVARWAAGAEPPPDVS
jgi:transposase